MTSTYPNLHPPRPPPRHPPHPDLQHSQQGHGSYAANHESLITSDCNSAGHNKTNKYPFICTSSPRLCGSRDVTAQYSPTLSFPPINPVYMQNMQRGRLALLGALWATRTGTTGFLGLDGLEPPGETDCEHFSLCNTALTTAMISYPHIKTM